MVFSRETVRKQIMWLIASIYKYSLKSGQEWPDLLKFINELILSAQPEQHIVNFRILEFFLLKMNNFLMFHIVGCLHAEYFK